MHAIIRGEQPELISGAFQDANGTQHPANVLTLWTQAELAAIGVYSVVDDPIPDGQIVTGFALTLDGGVVRRSWTLEPAPPPPVPRSVTPLQIRRALRAEGLLDAVTEYVGSQPAEVQEAWEYAVAVYRDDAMLTAAAAALDKTEAEVDDLFRLAATK